MHITTYATGSVTATGTICQLGTTQASLPVGALVGGTFVGTVQVQVSYDPEATSPTWVLFSSALTAAGTVKVDIPVKAVRLQCTAYTSGTIVGGLGVTLA